MNSHQDTKAQRKRALKKVKKMNKKTLKKFLSQILALDSFRVKKNLIM